MIIERIIKRQILKRLKPGKVVVLVGPRRTGKTVLLEMIKKEFTSKTLSWNGEDIAVWELLKRRTIQNYKNILGETKLLLIDESQKIPGIGNILKLMIDSIPQLAIIVTGSSAFDIKKFTGEPLTGRKYDFFLFPLSELELDKYEEPQQRFDKLKDRLIFGNMPELLGINDQGEKAEYLKSLVNSYLLKDILVYERISDSAKIFNLLKLIAFQAGSEVSLEELGRQLSISKNTVERYLDLLSKVFVIHKLGGFSRNLRKEVTKHSKWYFYDNGIRNAVISNFSPLELRNDTGLLWENYMISERLKAQHYNKIISNNYFWRTYDQQEIDWIEEREGHLFPYEFKWKNQKVKTPAAWGGAYPGSNVLVIHQENYRAFCGLQG